MLFSYFVTGLLEGGSWLWVLRLGNSQRVDLSMQRGIKQTGNHRSNADRETDFWADQELSCYRAEEKKPL